MQEAEMAANILISLSAIAVALAALFGFKKWRQELKGKAGFELSRNLIIHIYKVQSSLKWTVFPFTSSFEGLERPRHDDNESFSVWLIRNDWYAREQRLKKWSEEMPKLVELGWEAEVVFDKNTSEQVSKVVKLVRERYAAIASAIQEYFDLKVREANGEDVSQHKEWLASLMEDVYSTEKDEPIKQIDDAINDMSFALKSKYAFVKA